MGDGSWDRDLMAAFTVLLGRPVDGFASGADYRLYYLNTANPEGVRWFFTALDDGESLRRVWLSEVRPTVLETCLSPDWRLDLGRSVFEIDFLEESGLAEAFGALPHSNLVSEAVRVVSGRELAAVLGSHGLGPAEVAGGIGGGAFTVRTALRVVTDGSLRDALLAAIRGRRGPDGLRPGPGEAAFLPLVNAVFTDNHEEPPPAVERLLASIGDARLRTHLWSPYLDRPWDRGGGAGVPTWWRFVADRSRATFVAAWDLAYFGEISLAVVRDGAAPAE